MEKLREQFIESRDRKLAGSQIEQCFPGHGRAFGFYNGEMGSV
jgi:hypothetical protein